jgi:hypothetical protein
MRTHDPLLAEASCTAGGANFITGELPIRTGMTNKRPAWPSSMTMSVW